LILLNLHEKNDILDVEYENLELFFIKMIHETMLLNKFEVDEIFINSTHQVLFFVFWDIFYILLLVYFEDK